MAVSTQELWRQVGEIFDRALELPWAERGVFLAHACARDDRLRSEVEHLLSAYAESGDFLALPTAGFLTSSVGEEQLPRQRMVGWRAATTSGVPGPRARPETATRCWRG